MLRQRRGHLLRDWIQKAELNGPDAVGVLAGSIRQDLDAVTAGLTLPYSSGIVEGHVNRIKTIKQQMYGRASFALLRARILLQSCAQGANQRARHIHCNEQNARRCIKLHIIAMKFHI